MSIKLKANEVVEVWSQPHCPACISVKNLLKLHNLPYEEKMIGVRVSKEDLFQKLPQARSVPQVFIGDEHIGGLNELIKFLDDND